jgi:hypothetical protein
VTPEFELRIDRKDDPVIGFLKHKNFPSASLEIHQGASTSGASSPKVGFYLLQKNQLHVVSPSDKYLVWKHDSHIYVPNSSDP